MIKKLKVIILNYAKKNHWFLVLLRRIKHIRGRINYLIYNIIFKTDAKLIIFESFMGRSYADSPKAIYENMVNDKKYGNYKFVWAFKKPNEKEKYFNNKNTILIKYKSKEYYKYYSKAKYWISNSRIPEYIKKRKDQVYIQTWHGTPLKRLGFDIKIEGGNALNSVKEIQNKYLTDAKRYNFMISPSKFCTKKFISAFNLKSLKKEDIVIEEGYPRNDFLFKYTKKDVIKIKKELNIPLNKKVILYAPTWRDNQHTSGVGYTYRLGIDFDKLKAKLSKDYIILFRTHYFISNSFDFDKYKDFIYDVSDYDDINHLYVISDLLITDYSSVFFDYANLKRPMIFYMYDLDIYKNKLRDFYIDLPELPGPIVKKEKDLIKEINNIDNYFNKYKTKYMEFNNRYNYLDDDKASKRVIERVIE